MKEKHVKVIVVSMRNCPACDVLKAALRRSSVTFRTVDAESGAGPALLPEVKTVPTVFLDLGDDEYVRVRAPSVQTIREAVGRHS